MKKILLSTVCLFVFITNSFSAAISAKELEQFVDRQAFYHFQEASKNYFFNYFEIALEYINASIEREPDKAQSYSLRAIIKESLGDKSGAKKDFKKAKQIEKEKLKKK